jgi:superfamily II DNA or RNA helicase
MRILADLLAQHSPERILIFTADNATVYRISQDFLIPALTHQTPVKERHEILTRFKEGIYKTIIASHVLNEGVDVPDARVAILLSGTGSTREYIQRLGRILRKGTQKNKRAILYEVVAENTAEEGTSQRRRGLAKTRQPKESKPQQLELLPGSSQPTSAPTPIYGVGKASRKKVAERASEWGEKSPKSSEHLFEVSSQDYPENEFPKKSSESEEGSDN